MVRSVTEDVAALRKEGAVADNYIGGGAGPDKQRIPSLLELCINSPGGKLRSDVWKGTIQ